MSRPRTPEEWKAASARRRAAARLATAGILADLGPALRWLRKRRRLRQADLAEAAGITRPMLSAYERGKVQPTIESLERLLMALECDLVQLGLAIETRPWREAGSPSAALTEEELAFSKLKQGIFDWLNAMRRSALGLATGGAGDGDGGGAA